MKAYACQEYSIERLCRYDRREIDGRCSDCQRITDRAYLERMGLWIPGVSHPKKNSPWSLHLPGHFMAK